MIEQKEDPMTEQEHPESESSPAGNARTEEEFASEADPAKEPAEDFEDEMMRLQMSAAEWVGELADVAEQLSDEARQLVDEGREQVRQHPWATVAGVFAAGVVIGMLWRRK